MRNRIVLIAPRQGLVIHSGIDVFEKKDAEKVNEYVRNWTQEYGEVERIILSMGTVRIMEPYESIPVPLRPGKGLMIPGGGALY